MATRQQRAAVDKLVEIGGTSVSRAMRESRFPYTPKTAKTPKKLTESKGFKEIMAEYGLTEGLISKALVEDIKSKPKKREPELRLGAKILKMTDDSIVNDNRQIIINISDEKSRRLLDRKAPPIGEE